MRTFRIIAMLVCASMSFLCGCVNVCVRGLAMDRIEETYQCTKTAFGFSYVLMFPQVMSPTGGEHFMWENLLTIPVGVIGFADTACEAVIDTVCLPVDWPLSAYRNKK